MLLPGLLLAFGAALRLHLRLLCRLLLRRLLLASLLFLLAARFDLLLLCSTLRLLVVALASGRDVARAAD